jgi:flagellar M-ring protein FliF
MNQLRQLWEKLTVKQRAWLAVAFVSVIGGLIALNHWNQERDFKPLFTGLAPEDAATVTAKMKELGTEYRLADNGSTVLVPSEKLAEMRLQLAGAGLPKTGRIGFELFDKANFGASEFTEQVNFNRAMEGELERSVMSIREVELARVHITPAKDSIYTEERQPAKASVLVKLRRASALSPQNVQAICQLLASAVPGLGPDQVTVVDTSGNLLNCARAAINGAEPSEATLDYRKSIERDLQLKIASTLDPLIGAEHFRVGVSADVDLTSAEQNEETYDPQKAAIASSQKTEDGPGLPSASGTPGTASNLPRPTAQPTTSQNALTQFTRHTENTSYQTSRLIRHVKIPEGAVKRLSVSVLVDHSLRWEGDKKIIEPPSADKLKVIRDLVSAAAGLETTRGDQLVVDAFPFEATLGAQPISAQFGTPLPPPAKIPSFLEQLLALPRFKLLAGVGLAVLLVAIGGLFALRSKSKTRRKITATANAVVPASANPAELPPTREEIEKQIQDRIEHQAAEQARKEAEALMDLKISDLQTKKSDVLNKHIAAEAKKDPGALAQVVRAWLNADRQRNEF